MKASLRKTLFQTKANANHHKRNLLFSRIFAFVQEIGRIFLREGNELPSKTENFDCLFILNNWVIYEGWVKFSSKYFALILECDAKSYITSKLKGEGTFYYPDTSFKKGFWKKNFRIYGYGICHLHDKETYKGMHVCGEKDGYGICEYQDNGFYKRMWKNNKKDSFGTMKYADGSYFKGKWSDDGEHSGEKKFANGETFIGVLKEPFAVDDYRGVYTYLNL